MFTGKNFEKMTLFLPFRPLISIRNTEKNGIFRLKRRLRLLFSTPFFLQKLFYFLGSENREGPNIMKNGKKRVIFDPQNDPFFDPILSATPLAEVKK